MTSSLLPSHPPLRIFYAEDNECDSFIFDYIIKKLFPDIELIIFSESMDLIHYILRAERFSHREKILSYHMVFLDINLPKLDGFEVLHMIKSNPNPNVSKLPIFMISTSSRSEDIKKSQELGALGYVLKSTSYEAMKTSLHNLIHQSFQEGHVLQTHI
jgi:two-component system, response regulator